MKYKLEDIFPGNMGGDEAGLSHPYKLERFLTTKSLACRQKQIWGNGFISFLRN